MIQCLYSSVVRALCAASLPKWVPSPHLTSGREKHYHAVEYTFLPHGKTTKVSQGPHDIVTDVRPWLPEMGQYCTNQNTIRSSSLEIRICIFWSSRLWVVVSWLLKPQDHQVSPRWHLFLVVYMQEQQFYQWTHPWHKVAVTNCHTPSSLKNPARCLGVTGKDVPPLNH